MVLLGLTKMGERRIGFAQTLAKAGSARRSLGEGYGVLIALVKTVASAVASAKVEMAESFPGVIYTEKLSPQPQVRLALGLLK